MPASAPAAATQRCTRGGGGRSPRREGVDEIQRPRYYLATSVAMPRHARGGEGKGARSPGREEAGEIQASSTTATVAATSQRQPRRRPPPPPHRLLAHVGQHSPPQSLPGGLPRHPSPSAAAATLSPSRRNGRGAGREREEERWHCVAVWDGWIRYRCRVDGAVGGQKSRLGFF